jgi:hypothetical protein
MRQKTARSHVVDLQHQGPSGIFGSQIEGQFRRGRLVESAGLGRAPITESPVDRRGSNFYSELQAALDHEERNSMSITVLDPTQSPLAEDLSSATTPAPRLDTLNGKVIGLWNNEKLNAALLLEMIREELEKRFSFDVVRGVYDPSNLMPEDGWGDVDGCDAVILANGDCGACSTSGIVNAIELEKRGIPTLLVSTPPFLDAVKTSASLRGMPAIRWAVVDHPVAMLKEDDLRQRAISAANQAPSILLGA